MSCFLPKIVSSKFSNMGHQSTVVGRRSVDIERRKSIVRVASRDELRLLTIFLSEVPKIVFYLLLYLVCHEAENSRQYKIVTLVIFVQYFHLIQILLIVTLGTTQRIIERFVVLYDNAHKSHFYNQLLTLELILLNTLLNLNSLMAISHLSEQA